MSVQISIPEFKRAYATAAAKVIAKYGPDNPGRSEEHTSELQSRQSLVRRIPVVK